MVSDEVVIALVSAFGSVISGLVVQVLRQLSRLTADMSAVKAHLGVRVEGGVAIPLERKNGSALAYEAKR